MFVGRRRITGHREMQNRNNMVLLFLGDSADRALQHGLADVCHGLRDTVSIAGPVADGLRLADQRVDSHLPEKAGEILGHGVGDTVPKESGSVKSCGVTGRIRKKALPTHVRGREGNLRNAGTLAVAERGRVGSYPLPFAWGLPWGFSGLTGPFFSSFGGWPPFVITCLLFLKKGPETLDRRTVDDRLYIYLL